MTPERWEKVRDLLHGAMQLEVEERPAFLDSHCSDDPSLRQELERLLAANATVRASFLEPTVVAHVASDLIPSHGNVLPEGTRLGPYVVLGLIGAGGMGEVYRARDERLDRTVAIKVIASLFSSDPLRRQRLQREARAISAVQHPNICALYDIGQDDGIDYLVMEFLDGQTLGEYVRSKAMPLELILRYGVEIADALDAAHRRGITHRDLKPGNIFLTAHGECKVLDFGLAQMESDVLPDTPTVVERDVLSTPGVAMGTAPYMSPEQARGETLDSRTDIFSFGSVLYEMATGQMAFRGKTSAVIFKAILDTTPPAPTEMNESLPERLDEVIGKCLEKDRDLRYQSAADLRTDLKRLQRDSGPQHISAVGDSDRLSIAKRSRRRWVMLEVVMALLVLAGVAVYYWRTQPLAKIAFRSYQMTALASTGNVAFADVSPDGRYLAYSDDEVGKQSLWVKHLATGTTIRVLGPLLPWLGRWLRFAPDGNYFYYSHDEPASSTHSLYRLAVLGGPPEKILSGIGSSVDFSPDGKRIVFARPTDTANYLLTANTDGGGERRLLELPPNETIGAPAWAPDGRTIAFSIDEAGSGNENCIAVIASEGGKERRILRNVSGIHGMAWLPDQSGLVITGWLEGTENSAVWIVSNPEGKLRRVTNDLVDYLGIGIVHSDRRMVTVQKQMDSSLWVASALDPSQATQLREGAGKEDGMLGIAWLPDGHLVYGSGSQTSELWLVDRDGANRRQLTHTNNGAQGPSATRAGTEIVMSTSRSPLFNIWRIDADGSNAKPITSGSGDKWNVEISPDGKWITYYSAGAPWKMALPGGVPVKLAPNGGYPSISPDGLSIAFEVWDQKENKNTIKIVASDGSGSSRRLPFISDPQVPESTNMGGLPIRWTASGDAISYVRTKDGISNLWRQPINGGPAKQITHFTSMLIWRHAWSPDGKYLALARGNFSRDAVLLTDLH